MRKITLYNIKCLQELKKKREIENDPRPALVTQTVKHTEPFLEELTVWRHCVEDTFLVVLTVEVSQFGLPVPQQTVLYCPVCPVHIEATINIREYLTSMHTIRINQQRMFSPL